MIIVSKSDLGMHRDMNQDYIFSTEKPIGMFPNLFMLADGMGGHRAGDMASKMTVEYFKGFVKFAKGDTPLKALGDGLKYVNRLVYDKARSELAFKGMGTTLVGGYFKGSTVYLLNVGDSRAYRISDDDIVQITQDHSYVAEMVRNGLITEAEAKVHPERNIITRAVGTSDSIEADFYEMGVFRGEKILLCSDGLYNMVDEDEILEIVSSMSDEDAVDALIRRANENGGSDNISIILINPWNEEVR